MRIMPSTAWLSFTPTSIRFENLSQARPFRALRKDKAPPLAMKMADRGARCCPRPIHLRSRLAQGRTCDLRDVSARDVSPRLTALSRMNAGRKSPLDAPTRQYRALNIGTGFWVPRNG